MRKPDEEIMITADAVRGWILKACLWLEGELEAFHATDAVFLSSMMVTIVP